MPLKRDDQKVKRSQYPVASNQYPDNERLTASLIPKQQPSSKEYPNQETANSDKQTNSQKTA